MKKTNRIRRALALLLTMALLLQNCMFTAAGEAETNMPEASTQTTDAGDGQQDSADLQNPDAAAPQESVSETESEPETESETETENPADMEQPGEDNPDADENAGGTTGTDTPDGSTDEKDVASPDGNVAENDTASSDGNTTENETASPDGSAAEKDTTAADGNTAGADTPVADGSTSGTGAATIGENIDGTNSVSAPEQETPDATTPDASAAGNVCETQADDGAAIRVEGLQDGCSVTAAAIAGAEADPVAETIAKLLYDAGDSRSLLGINVYDITVLGADSQPIQPEGTVSVQISGITAPEGTTGALVYHMAEDGSAELVTELGAESFADGSVRFTTDHFSIYAIAYCGEAEAMLMATVLSERKEDDTLKLDGDKHWSVMYGGQEAKHWLTLEQILGEENIETVKKIDISIQKYANYITADKSAKTVESYENETLNKINETSYWEAGTYTYEVTLESEEIITATLDITRRPLYIATPNVSVYYYEKNDPDKGSDDTKCYVYGNLDEIKENFGDYTVEWPVRYIDPNTLEVSNEQGEQGQKIQIEKHNEAREIRDAVTQGTKGDKKYTGFRRLTFLQNGKVDGDNKLHNVSIVLNTLVGFDPENKNVSTDKICQNETGKTDVLKLPTPSSSLAPEGYKYSQPLPEWKAPNAIELTTDNCKVKIQGTGDIDCTNNYVLTLLPGTLEIKPVARVRYNFTLDTASHEQFENDLTAAGLTLGYVNPNLGTEEFDDSTNKKRIMSITNHMYRAQEEFTIPKHAPEAEGYEFVAWYDKFRYTGSEKSDTYVSYNPAMRSPGETVTFVYDGNDLYTLDALWLSLEGKNQEKVYDGTPLGLQDIERVFTKGDLESKYDTESDGLITVDEVKWIKGDHFSDESIAEEDWTEYKATESGGYPQETYVGVYPYTFKAKVTVKKSSDSEDTITKEIRIVRTITIYPRPITIKVANSTYTFDGQEYKVKNTDDEAEYVIESSDDESGLVTGDAFADEILDVVYYLEDFVEPNEENAAKSEYSKTGEKGHGNALTKYTATIEGLDNEPIDEDWKDGSNPYLRISGDDIIKNGEKDVSGNYYIILKPGTLIIQPGDKRLIIKKMLDGPNEAIQADKEKVFKFRLQIPEEADKEYDYYIEDSKGSYISEGKIENNGILELKHNQQAVILNLKNNTQYKVTEELESSDDKFFIVDSQNAEGTISITAGTPAVAEFTNTVAGYLKVTKTVSGNAGEIDKDFNFTVNLKTADNESVSGTYSELTFDTNGNATFTLKNGGSKEIKLPAGLAYTVTETSANQNGYKTTIPANATGTIPAKDTAEVAFTNTRNPVTPTLEIVKNFATNGHDLKNSYTFSFILTPQEGNPDGYPVEGSITKSITVGPSNVSSSVANTWTNKIANIFDGKSYTKPGTYKYTLAEQNGGSTINGVIYDNTQYEVTVNVNEDTVTGPARTGNLTANVTVTSITAGSGEASAVTDPVNVAFTNSYDPTDAEATLEGSKVIREGTDIDKTPDEGQFTFVLTPIDGAPMPSSETGAGGTGVTPTAGSTVDETTDPVTTKNDTKGNFKFGPITYTKAGTYKYQITEQLPTTASGESTMIYDTTVYEVSVTVKLDEASGTLTAGTPVYSVIGTTGTKSEAAFTNFIPVKTETAPGTSNKVSIGDEISYEIAWMNPNKCKSDVTITDVLDEGVDFVSASDGGTYDPATRTVTWQLKDKNAGATDAVTLTVKVNAKAAKPDTTAAGGSGTDIKYSVSNSANVSVTNKNGSSTASQSADTNTVTNELKTGNLTVSKTVAGTEGEQDKEFHFTVKLVDEEGKPVAGVSETYSDLSFTDGVSEKFLLKHGESKTITGLPAGIDFVVVEDEANQDGYATQAKYEKGTKIKANETVTAAFTNTKPAASITLEGKKTYEGGTLVKDQFSFTLKPIADAPMPILEGVEAESVTVKNDESGDFSFGEIRYAGIGTYKYTITEEPVKTGDIVCDGRTYTVTVSVALDSTSKFTASAKYEVLDVSGNVITTAGKAEFTNFKPVKTQTVPAAEKSVAAGDSVTYEITWRNPGAEAADIEIKDTLDAGVDFDFASDGGAYDPATRTVTWNLADKTAGASGKVTLTVKVNKDAKKTIANQADYSIGEGESKVTVKTNEVTTTVDETTPAPTPSTPAPSTDPTDTPSSETPATEPTPEPTPTPDAKPAETPVAETPATETAVPKTASIKVTKSCTYEETGESITLLEAEFYVALFADADLTQQIGAVKKLSFNGKKETASATFKGLESGTYYVAETDASGKPVSNGEFEGGLYKTKYPDGGRKVTVKKKDGAVAFAIENQFSKLPDPQFYRYSEEHTESETEPVTEEKETETETAAAGQGTNGQAGAQSVKTGDTTPIAVMILLMVLSAFLLAVLGYRRRRA